MCVGLLIAYCVTEFETVFYDFIFSAIFCLIGQYPIKNAPKNLCYSSTPPPTPSCFSYCPFKVIGSVVVDSLFIVAPSVCGGFVFGPCSLIHCLVFFQVI